MQKKFNIRLNSSEKVEQLLQETYDLSTTQINQIQAEINKISNSTVLKDLEIDGREKYAKIMNNYLTTIQKAIDRKFEIARFMGEVMKHGGDINKTLEESSINKNTELNLKQIRDAVKQFTADNSNEQYQLKNPKNNG